MKRCFSLALIVVLAAASSAVAQDADHASALPGEPLLAYLLPSAADAYGPMSVRAYVQARVPAPEAGTVRQGGGEVEPREQEVARARNDALINGALIGLGAVGIIDNVVFHWLFELHRAVPGPHALEVEIGIIAVSAVMLTTGIVREVRARRR